MVNDHPKPPLEWMLHLHSAEQWERLLQVVPNYPEKGKVQELISRAKQHSKMPGFGG